MENSAHVLSWWQRLIYKPYLISRRNALLWGAAWLIIASMIGWYFRIVPTSIVDFTLSGYVPLIWHVVLNVVLWLCSSVVVYLFAVMLNRGVSVVELFGRMLFAHAPIVVVMMPALIPGGRIAYAEFMNDSIWSLKADLYWILFTLLFVVVVLWYFWWGYQALLKSIRIDDIATKRDRVKLLYAIALVLSNTVSAWCAELLFKVIMR